MAKALALIPKISVQENDFDLKSEINALTQGRKDVGAVISFTGLCRDENGTLKALELEHYPAMATAQLTKIATNAATRWPLTGLTVIHRFGKIKPGANIVLVVAASSHRRAAFEAADYLMDYLKSEAPFWKKEHLINNEDGGWVEAKQTDTDDLKRW